MDLKELNEKLEDKRAKIRRELHLAALDARLVKTYAAKAEGHAVSALNHVRDLAQIADEICKIASPET